MSFDTHLERPKTKIFSRPYFRLAVEVTLLVERNSNGLALQ